MVNFLQTFYIIASMYPFNDIDIFFPVPYLVHYQRETLKVQ